MRNFGTLKRTITWTIIKNIIIPRRIILSVWSSQDLLPAEQKHLRSCPRGILIRCWTTSAGFFWCRGVATVLWAPRAISNTEPRHRSEKADFCCSYPWIHSSVTTHSVWSKVRLAQTSKSTSTLSSPFTTADLYPLICWSTASLFPSETLRHVLLLSSLCTTYWTSSGTVYPTDWFHAAAKWTDTGNLLHHTLSPQYDNKSKKKWSRYFTAHCWKCLNFIISLLRSHEYRLVSVSDWL